MDRDRFYDIAVSVASRMSGELKDGALATLSGTVINEVGSDDYHEVRFQVLDGNKAVCTFGIWPSKDLAELGDGPAGWHEYTIEWAGRSKDKLHRMGETSLLTGLIQSKTWRAPGYDTLCSFLNLFGQEVQLQDPDASVTAVAHEKPLDLSSVLVLPSAGGDRNDALRVIHTSSVDDPALDWRSCRSGLRAGLRLDDADGLIWILTNSRAGMSDA